MRKLVAFCLLYLPVLAFAADGDYGVTRIPPALLKNADAVVRLEEMRFEIVSTKQTIQRDHYVITILNENGDKWAAFYEYYDKFREIESIEGVLYDAAGKQLKRVKKKDIADLSGVDDGSWIDDNRVKSHNFYYRVYPYTIEYTCEINTKGTLFFPKWVPQPSDRIAVEKSVMTMVCPEDYNFRYKMFRYPGEPVITHEKNTKLATWSVANVAAIVREPYAPMWHELSTVVIFGPTDFQLEDYKGNMVNWQDFGKFVYALKTGREKLPDNIRQTVHSIADGITDPFQKVAKLYQYMQDNTRYVGIQLGIGGWQPFDASFVATKRYGDCKALSNYMYSLLKEVGINSYYTLIRADRNSNYITDDFPAQQFNHAILCVPLAKDTVWLECTSQTAPPGYLGRFTADRYALLIDENGGKLVRTPKYGLKDNLQIRRVKARLGEDGTLHLNSASRYTGLQQDNIHSLISSLSKDKVKEYLHEQLDFATYEINAFDYKEEKNVIPAINESLDIAVSNYATITGKRLFIVPNTMSRSYTKLSRDTARQFDIQLSYEYIDIDTAEIDLPAGYAPEAMPQDVAIGSKFGKYNCTVKLKDNKIYYYRNLEFYGGRYPAAEFNDLAKFYESIYKADRNRIVLVKTDVPLKGF